MADSSKNLYNSQRWRNLRKNFLDLNPLCVYCKQAGKIKPADVVDHIVPHKGNLKLFWDESNLQALCKTCHDSAKALKENKGIAPGCGLDGVPLDKNHPWNR